MRINYNTVSDKELTEIRWKFPLPKIAVTGLRNIAATNKSRALRKKAKAILASNYNWLEV